MDGESNNVCVFCQIVNGEKKEQFIYEDEFCIVVADPVPRERSHFLVIPKLHIPRIDEISDDQTIIVANMIRAAMKVVIEKGIAKNAYHLVINGGEKLGHKIFHLHLHIMGGA